jgi:hypothetical protein
VLYSKWDPSRGGYSYFETAEQVPFAADLPTPRLSAVGPIGVPSVDAGRPLPSGAHMVGTGPLARGLIVPTEGRGVLGSLAVNSRDLIVAACGAIGGYLLSVWWRKRR